RARARARSRRRPRRMRRSRMRLVSACPPPSHPRISPAAANPVADEVKRRSNAAGNAEVSRMRPCSWLALAALTVVVALDQSAQAQTKVRVGQPQAGTFQFVPLQVGAEAGIFKRHGIDLEVVSFGGGPRVQQALAADAIDIGIGSGPELAFVAKGA